jgi:hypothetical protein
MTTSEQKKTTGASFESPERRETGITGPSQERSQREQTASFAEGYAGQEMNELEWARRHVHDRAAPHLVERKTEIIGCGVPAGKKKALSLSEKAKNISIDISPELLENNGDLVFLLLDHMHRIAERQDKKIERLQRRLSAVEERGVLP